MNTKKHLSELHHELKEWTSNIAFATEEMTTFRKELEDIAGKYSKPEVLSVVEQFQNRFIRHQEISDELNHEIGVANHRIAELSKDNPASDHVLVDDHIALRDQATTYIKLYKELGQEYRHFLAKYM
jgi:chromosome segregation ATPase